MFDNWLHYSYLPKRKQGRHILAFKMLSIHHQLFYQSFTFYQNRTYKKAIIDYKYQHQSIIGPAAFLYQISNNNITTIDLTYYILETGLDVQ